MKLKIVAYPSSLSHELLVKLFCQTLFLKQLSFTEKAAHEASLLMLSYARRTLYISSSRILIVIAKAKLIIICLLGHIS